MIRINLLPASERQSGLRLNRIFAVTSVFILLFCAGMYGYGVYTEMSLQEELQQTRNRYELLRPTQEKMVAANEKQQLINSKNMILLDLTKERQSWHAVLSHLGAVTPAPVWLTEMDANGKGVVLKGMAVTYPDLAGFIEKMAKDGLFTEPALIRAERDTSLPVTRFELSVKLKGL